MNSAWETTSCRPPAPEPSSGSTARSARSRLRRCSASRSTPTRSGRAAWSTRHGLADFEARIDAEHPPVTGDVSVGEALRPRVGDAVFEALDRSPCSAASTQEMPTVSRSMPAPHSSPDGGAIGRVACGPRCEPRSTLPRPQPPGPSSTESRAAIAASSTPWSPSSAIGCGSANPPPALEREGDAVGGHHRHRRRHSADRVVLATPGWVTAGLIAPYASTAAGMLADLVYGDAVLVTFVVADLGDRSATSPARATSCRAHRGCSRPPAPGHRRSGRTTTTANTPILRVSAGRSDDDRWISMDLDAVVAQTHRRARGS